MLFYVQVRGDVFCPSLHLLENECKNLYLLCCVHALGLSIWGSVGCIASVRQSQQLLVSNSNKMYGTAPVQIDYMNIFYFTSEYSGLDLQTL